MKETLGLETRYHRARAEGSEEPSWVEDLPVSQRMWLRYSYAIHSEDPLAIMNNFPYTGIWYMVSDGCMCEEIERLFNLRRLQQVKQLGFLQQPWVAMSDQRIVLPLGKNTRFAHSLDVLALASVIGHNIGLSANYLNVLRTAAFTHDWGTPAGGDSVKHVDAKGLDEDLNYERLLGRLPKKMWRNFKSHYNINEQTLVRTILNQGLLGEVLDIADKLAYVARDIDTVLRVMHDPNEDSAYVGMRALQEIVDEFPYVCSIWDSVKVVGDRLVFEDVWRLLGFLKARIVLFRELYYHPRARFGEYLISRVLVKMLYDKGELTRDELLEMGDFELESRLNSAYGADNILRALSTKANVRSFKTQEEALAFELELKGAGNRFALVEDHLHSVKTCAHLLVETKSGIKPLSEAYKGDARELDEMANMHPAVHVYYFGDDPEAPDDEMADLLDMMRTQTVAP